MVNQVVGGNRLIDILTLITKRSKVDIECAQEIAEESSGFGYGTGISTSDVSRLNRRYSDQIDCSLHTNGDNAVTFLTRLMEYRETVVDKFGREILDIIAQVGSAITGDTRFSELFKEATYLLARNTYPRAKTLETMWEEQLEPVYPVPKYDDLKFMRPALNAMQYGFKGMQQLNFNSYVGKDYKNVTAAVMLTGLVRRAGTAVLARQMRASTFLPDLARSVTSCGECLRVNLPVGDTNDGDNFPDFDGPDGVAGATFLFDAVEDMRFIMKGNYIDGLTDGAAPNNVALPLPAANVISGIRFWVVGSDGSVYQSTKSQNLVYRLNGGDNDSNSNISVAITMKEGQSLYVTSNTPALAAGDRGHHVELHFSDVWAEISGLWNEDGTSYNGILKDAVATTTAGSFLESFKERSARVDEWITWSQGFNFNAGRLKLGLILSSNENTADDSNSSLANLDLEYSRLSGNGSIKNDLQLWGPEWLFRPVTQLNAAARLLLNNQGVPGGGYRSVQTTQRCINTYTNIYELMDVMARNSPAFQLYKLHF